MAVGNVSPRKGFEYLIRAADILKTEFNDMFYFIVGGKHHKETEEYEKLASLIDEMGLKKSVIITGRMSNVPEVLKYCDLYIMPSIVEGLGLSLIEALAMEKIAIASDIEPFKEIVDDNVNGFFFKSSDHSDLAEKIKMIRKTDEVSLLGIRQNARKTVLEKFNSDKMVKEYEDLYGKSFR
jgi:glycosyltransferase involved in cell wall biosynthesis